MSDPRIIRLNEQLKGVSSVFFNLGAATVAAAAGRTAIKGDADWIGVGWFVGALVLIWIGTKVPTLMESDR